MNTKPHILVFPISQQILFAKRLALYLDSGIPILEGLHLLSRDTRDTSCLYIYTEIEARVAAGQPLSMALTLFPRCFSSFSVGFIQIGESTGSLSTMLEKLSIVLQKRRQVRTKILSALLYPVIVFCSTICMALFLTLFIFPKIIPVLRSLKIPLPLTTRILISIHNVLQHNWIIILLVAILCVLVFGIASRYTRVQLAEEHILLRLPIFSKLYRNYVLTSFLYTLSVQLKSGVRILTALSLARDTVPGNIYPIAIYTIEESVSRGKRFSDIVSTFPNLFPILVSQMISVGELTGTLAINLESLSEEYEAQLDDVTKNLTVLVEPALMICMGVLVGFVALAIITPIYSVTQNLT